MIAGRLAWIRLPEFGGSTWMSQLSLQTQVKFSERHSHFLDLANATLVPSILLLVDSYPEKSVKTDYQNVALLTVCTNPILRPAALMHCF